jgi:serine/threonine protein kinase
VPIANPEPIGRFHVVRRIGEGGMSVVYEAIDRERGTRVALKTMRELTPTSIARLKHEFRVLQDVSHPSLVTLGELVCEEDRCFYTMELVEGDDFVSYVRAGLAPSAEGEKVAVDRIDRVDRARLRDALGQLAHALEAMHAAGVVHRDVKPSNVRVTPAGRVVLLDFGLAIDEEAGTAVERGSGRWRKWSRSERRGAGTPMYMAPEQSAGRRVGPEADWYAVGVLLYEALTGRTPFGGTSAELALKKRQLKPPPPRSFVSSVSLDMDALCVALLRRDPRTRAGFRDVLAVLGGPIEAPPRPLVREAPSLVGRRAELAQLRTAFDESRFKGAVLVHVVGESGIGKSSLVRALCEDVLDRHPDAVVLSGRCYERETVPFKAVDGIVEALAGYLASLGARAAELVPTRPETLVHLFPVLGRTPALARVALLASPALDPRELRRRGFAAFRELMARIGERRPLVLAIDDLKWADDDSLALLHEVLRAPDSPNVLVVATTRGDPGLGASLSLVGAADAAPIDARTVRLERLSAEEARALAARCLRRHAPERESDADRIAAEGRGHPLWIESLAQSPWGSAGAEGSLHLALWTQVRALDAEVRAFVERVAIAGAPLSLDVLARAGGVARSVAEARVAALCEAKILAPSRAGAVEIRHERLRRAVLDHVDAERRSAFHREIAGALEASESVDLHALAVHWHDAGEPARAAELSERAGDEAMRALAFERAAMSYGRALDGHRGDAARSRAVGEKLARALASAGHSARAAEAYAAAAHGAPPDRAVELRRLAADQKMRAGHYDEALRALVGVLADVGIRHGTSAWATLIWAAMLRLWIALRGLEARTREASDVAPRDLACIDACSTAAWGLAATDHARGAAFQARALALALRAGEPERLSRALVMESIVVASTGESRRDDAEDLLARAHALAARAGSPQARALCATGSGIVMALAGNFRDAVGRLESASDTLAAHCAGSAWEIETLRFFTLTCLAHLGELRELCVRTPRYLREARERGDVYAAVHMRVGAPNLRWLVDDRPDVARREVHEAMAEWSDEGFHLEHWYAVSALVNVDLYDGRATAAYDRIVRAWQPMRRAGMHRVQMLRIQAWQTRGRAALALAEASRGESRAALLAEGSRAATALEKERAAWARPLASLLRAGAAQLDDARAARGAALSLLAAAEEEARSAGLVLHELAAARLAGALVGRVSSAAPQRRWDRWMTAQGVRDPAKLARMIAPGGWRTE